ncbi:MAG TPA: hypothetical protein VEY30_09785 [Myxococcaceae bacterium]|nr:hypothetical protein [Myxococcaceae bacterium]
MGSQFIRGALAAALLLTFAPAGGCSYGLKDGYFVKGDVRYRIAAPPGGWKRLKLADNDVAYVSNDAHHSVAVNATCEDHADPPLDVLTQHMLLGFTDREAQASEKVVLDGREGLRSRYVARLDGVPVELDMVVMKKDGCVYDFVYLSPVGKADAQRAFFDSVLRQFAAERRA